MLKNTTAVAVLIAAILVLAGCAAGVDSSPHEAASKASAAAPTPTLTTPAPVLTASPTPDAEDQLVDATHKIPGLESVSKSDAVKVGRYVCRQLDSGVAPADITAVAATDPMNNADMIMISVLLLCPAHTDPAQQNVYDKRHQAAGQ